MNTDLIKKRIQELVPEKGHAGYGHDQLVPCKNCNERPITLSVVLRAIGKIQPANKTRVRVECDGQFLVYREPSKQHWAEATWNLEKDDWESQTRETQLFIGSLLQV